MNEQLIKFIELCLMDGVISDKEREVIFRKSKELGVPDDECEIILEGMIQQKKSETKNYNEVEIKVSNRNPQVPLKEIKLLVDEFEFNKGKFIDLIKSEEIKQKQIESKIEKIINENNELKHKYKSNFSLIQKELPNIFKIVHKGFLLEFLNFNVDEVIEKNEFKSYLNLFGKEVKWEIPYNKYEHYRDYTVKKKPKLPHPITILFNKKNMKNEVKGFKQYEIPIRVLSVNKTYEENLVVLVYEKSFKVVKINYEVSIENILSDVVLYGPITRFSKTSISCEELNVFSDLPITLFFRDLDKY